MHSPTEALKRLCDKEMYEGRIRAFRYVVRALMNNEPECEFSSDCLVVGLIATAVFVKARDMGHTADCADKMAARVTAMSEDALNLFPIPELSKCCQS